MTNKLKIKYVDPFNLVDYEFNSKDHPDKQINALANSIKEFGFNVPVVIDKSNIIIAGHGRVLAAKKLKLTEIPVIEKSDLTEVQVRKYRLLDNKIAELAEDNEDNIKMELLEIDDMEVNELFDFSMNLEDDLDDSFSLPDDEKGDMCQMTFTLHKDQRKAIEEAMDTAVHLGEFGDTGNENKNGNALARVAELFNGKDWKL